MSADDHRYSKPSVRRRKILVTATLVVPPHHYLSKTKVLIGEGPDDAQS